MSQQTVDNWLQRSLACHQVAALAEAPRSGRPVTAPQLTAAAILQHLQANPLQLGYRTTVWRVTLLATHLRPRHHGPITPATRRRRMQAMGLHWKRPRYVSEEQAPHRAPKTRR